MKKTLRVFHGIVFFVMCTLAPLSVRADSISWADSFLVEPLNTYLETSDLRLVVVGAGDDREALTSAIQALMDALRKTPRVALVMDSMGLGDVSHKDDGQIVAMAASLPVDVVAVLRLYPGRNPEKPVALVCLHALRSENQVCFSVEAGSPLVNRNQSRTPAASSAPVEEQGKLTPEMDQVMELAKAQYLKDYIVVRQFTRDTPISSGFQKIWFQQGQLGRPLSKIDFFNLVGHPELAQKQQRLNASKPAIAAGTFLVGFTLSSAAIRAASRTENNQFTTAQGIAFSIGMPIGLVGPLAVGTRYRPAAVSDQEALELAEKYNQDLAKRLGIKLGIPLSYREKSFLEEVIWP